MKALLHVTLIAVAAALCAVAPAQTNQVISGTPIPQATPGQPGIPMGATIPYVVSSKPSNGQRNVPWTTKKIEITFNEPMDVATFYWPLPNAPDFPLVSGDPYWTNGNRTVVLPVRLNPTRVYRIPINTSGQVFRSLRGVAANPGVISFETGQSSYGGTAKPSTVYGNQPFQGQQPTQPAASGGGAPAGGPATMKPRRAVQQSGAPSSSGGSSASPAYSTSPGNAVSVPAGPTGGKPQVGTIGPGTQDKIRQAQQLRQNRGRGPAPTPTPESGENQ